MMDKHVAFGSSVRMFVLLLPDLMLELVILIKDKDCKNRGRRVPPLWCW